MVPGYKLVTKNSGNSAGFTQHGYNVYNLDNRPQGKWAVIDFRADWCAACLELEEKTFSHPEIANLFKNSEWVMVRVDLTDTNSDTSKKITEAYGLVGLPTVQILSPSGNTCSQYTLSEFEGPDSFARRLKGAQKDCR